MTLELWVVGIYMLACIAIGVLASRKVLVSRDDYWVAGRRIGTSPGGGSPPPPSGPGAGGAPDSVGTARDSSGKNFPKAKTETSASLVSFPFAYHPPTRQRAVGSSGFFRGEASHPLMGRME